MSSSSCFCPSHMRLLSTDVALCLAHSHVFLTLNEGTKRERARKLNYCLGFRVILLKGGEKVTTSAWESFQAALKVVYILWREWFGSPESNCMSEKELFICLGEGGRKTSSSRGKQ